MKKILITTLLLSLFTLAIAQEKDASKMEKFASRTGQILKFFDYSLPDLTTTFLPVQTKVRRVESVGEVAYFYRITNKGEYGNKIATIAYEDLLELIKVLETLKGDIELHENSDADYLENKFITEDGFEIGYYISKTKLTWYLKLEKFGSDNIVFIKDVSDIENAFTIAKDKI